jgi:hypothetical protein
MFEFGNFHIHEIMGFSNYDSAKMPVKANKPSLVQCSRRA